MGLFLNRRPAKPFLGEKVQSWSLPSSGLSGGGEKGDFFHFLVALQPQLNVKCGLFFQLVWGSSFSRDFAG
jgi:hypothetical protein